MSLVLQWKALQSWDQYSVLLLLLMTWCVSYLICRRPSLKVRDLYLMISKIFNLSSTSPWASVLFISLLFCVWGGSVGSTLLLASIQWIICFVTSIIQSYLIAFKHTKSLQLCPALCDPMDSSPPVSWSMEFSSQKYWSGLPCPPPGGLPDLVMEPTSLMSPTLAGVFFTTSTTWKAPLHDSTSPKSF